MEANSNDANATTCIPMLEKLFITTPDVTREGDDNTSHNNAVPRINHEPPHYLKAVLPDPFLSTGKERQYPSDLAPPRNAKRVYRPRGNRLRGNAKPGLLKLPVELRLVIFRMVLGDRKVHVQYKRGLQSDSNSSQPKMAFVQYLPQYVFCHHDTFMEDPALQRVMNRISRYDNHHDLCIFPSVSLEKKLASAFKYTRMPETTPSPRSIELMYEPFELRLSLFAVSHRLREEALQIYHGTNTFSFATASFFNIFVSRLTDNKAALLRKVEFIYDRGDFYTSEDDEKSTQPPRWSLGVHNTEIMEKLANITDITIRYCNLYSVTRRQVWKDSKMLEVTEFDERLRRDFGGLGRLKSVMRVNVRVYDCTRPAYGLLGISKPPLDDVCLKNVGDKFAKEILGGGESEGVRETGVI